MASRQFTKGELKMEIKKVFCKDCKYMKKQGFLERHLNRFPYEPQCAHSDLITYDVVTGKAIFSYCSTMRQQVRNFPGCGPEGKLFEGWTTRVPF